MKSIWRKYSSGITWLLLSTSILFLRGGGWLGFFYFKDLRKSLISVSLVPAEQGNVELTFTKAGIIELGEQR
jgi:hypothetical protein